VSAYGSSEALMSMWLNQTDLPDHQASR